MFYSSFQGKARLRELDRIQYVQTGTTYDRPEQMRVAHMESCREEGAGQTHYRLRRLVEYRH